MSACITVSVPSTEIDVLVGRECETHTFDIEVPVAEIDVLIEKPVEGERGSQGIPGISPPSKWEHVDITSLILSEQFIDLMFLVEPDSLIVSFNGITQYEGVTYSLSTVGLITRVSLTGSLAAGGDYNLSTSDKLHFNYRYSP